MWRRATLKQHAKLFLKQHYWTAFAVCLVAIILGASSQSIQVVEKITPETGESISQATEWFSTGSGTLFDMITAPFRMLTRGILGLLTIGVGLFFVALRLVVGNNLRVGRARYFNHAIAGDNRFDYLFSTFKRGEWVELTFKLFYLDVVIFLWSLLLVIPGIIKTYQYKFVPFILAENPKYSIKQAMALSTSMTDNDKMNLFVLDLSFLGWYFLGSLLFGIGGMFVEPYVKATEATLYRLKEVRPDIRGE